MYRWHFSSLLCTVTVFELPPRGHWNNGKYMLVRWLKQQPARFPKYWSCQSNNGQMAPLASTPAELENWKFVWYYVHYSKEKSWAYPIRNRTVIWPKTFRAWQSLQSFMLDILLSRLRIVWHPDLASLSKQSMYCHWPIVKIYKFFYRHNAPTICTILLRSMCQ